MDAPPAPDRNALFQKLKPCCVKISQLAIREPEAPTAPRELLDLAKEVLATLNEQIQRDPAAVDDKISEYVFFPLYHIFRQMDRYPMVLVENCVMCLHILITYGWKSKISAQLVQQILSLLIFIVDGVPGSRQKREVPEETVLEAFRAQTALLNAAASSAAAASGLAQQETIPVLGHGVTVMLDGALDGASPLIQREALRSLQAVYVAVRQHEALATVLPGTVSSLAKMLSAPNRYKTAVVASGLEAVQTVLTRVLGDLKTRSILVQAKSQERDGDADKNKTLSPEWLKATASQVKLALSTIMKLRTQEAPQVRDALEKLCIALLDECHTTLSNCTSILVETAIILDRGADTTWSAQTSLRHLVGIYPELGETAKTTVYNWMSSLPRIMQMSDDDSKQTAVHNLSRGIDLLRSLGIESATLDDSISMALKDSMASLVLSSPQTVSPSTQLQLLDGTTPAAEDGWSGPQFQPVLLGRESQSGLRRELLGLVERLGSAPQKAKIAASLMDHVRESAQADRVAAMWLCHELIKASNRSCTETDAFLDLSTLTGPSEDAEPVFNDLYGFAVEVLDSHAEASDADWRLEALSLEVAAYAARRSGISFRPELIDVLFPIATFLGSEKPSVQQQAVAALNSIALSCQYNSVSDLIVDNVDYMVNTVALRLNSLDISPASMQVLLMMIRLAGPQLVPFLDDVVDSIFAALDNYHGYTLFVENLFSVLKEVVDQASRTDQRLLTDHERATVDHRKRPRRKDGLDSLLEMLDRRAERRARDAAEDASGELIDGHPNVPWTSELAGEEGKEDHPKQTGERSEERPANSPTYQLLLRIASLTQHYLTSPAPRLRRSLLELLTTASRVLAGDEDAFLPLVNAVWPVVVGRLYEAEAFITIEACHALSGLCEAAGDFLSSRFRTEWADGLGDWCRRVKQQASGGSTRFTSSRARSLGPGGGAGIMIPIRSGDGLGGGRETALEAQEPSAGSLGQHASPVKVWEAVVQLLTSMVMYVHVDDDMFDQMLDLLADVLEGKQEVREALEVVNADAVWLVRYERGYIEPLPTPRVEGFKLADMERMPRS